MTLHMHLEGLEVSIVTALCGRLPDFPAGAGLEDVPLAEEHLTSRLSDYP